MKKVLGIELNYDCAYIGVVNQYGEVEKQAEIKNVATEELLPNIASKALHLVDQWGYDFAIDIERIGFAVEGYVDHENGILKLNQQLGLRDCEIKKELIKLFKTNNISVLNRANALALGEFWNGSASNFNSEIFYSIDAHIGGAIVINGKLVSGENGFAGEFGHGGLMQSQKPCTCGLKGCLDPVSGMQSVIEQVKAKIQADPKSPFSKMFILGKEITPKVICNVYIRNNKPKEMRDIINEAFKPLYSHMAIMISALDPKAVIIGGMAAVCGDSIIELVEEGLQKLILNIYKDKLRIDISSLGTNGGIVGAAYYAINDWEF